MTLYYVAGDEEQWDMLLNMGVDPDKIFMGTQGIPWEDIVNGDRLLIPPTKEDENRTIP